METIQIETLDNIVILTINRPRQLNALNNQVITELEQTIDSIDCTAARCLVITGSGEKAFVAGADIAEMVDMDVSAARDFSQRGNNLMHKIENLPIPVIAAVQGFALGGGCELALSCDIRLASERAIFGLPETTLGVMPGFGGTQRLARLIGPARAKEIIFTAKSVNAQRALEIGLVNQVLPVDQFMEKVLAFAALIAANAPKGVQGAKAALNQGLQGDIIAGTAIEADIFASCFATVDQKNAMRAFVAKSPKPAFLNQ
jgi:enoyl-CoA hydratase